jgi:hypothetical protein
MNLTEERCAVKILDFERLYNGNRLLGAIARFSVQTKFYTFYSLRLCVARAGFLSVEWPSSFHKESQKKNTILFTPMLSISSL